MISILRRHFGWKLFLSYLIVIVAGVVVLAAAAELAIPRSFNRHMAAMQDMMGGMMSGGSGDVGADLFDNFRDAFTESLSLAALAATMVAVFASALISRRVVAPIQGMMTASRKVAEGDFGSRVEIPGSPRPEEMDELAQLAVSFNQMADRLDRTETMRRELIGDVAHELRTPLATIRGTVEGLLDGVVQADPDAYHQIYQETERLQRLVTDLQELSRVESGAYSLELRPVPVGRLVETVVDRLGRQFEEKGIVLETQLIADSLEVQVDEGRMGQVLLNLVGNALQYTPAGGTVRIAAVRSQDRLELQVQDTGTGIPKEHLPHVFTRFYRVDKSRSRAGGGTGIGLTIAKHLVEAQGGRLTAESPGPKQGSTFTVSLPL